MLDYQKIFDQRGKSYQMAMEKYPLARKQEFLTALGFIKPKSGMSLLDIPSGGGYLRDYLHTDINYLGYDFSGEFADNHSGISKCKESKLALGSGSIDVALSLAAHHHIVDREGFYNEVHRVLKNRGRFIIVDIEMGSKVDTFLNGFVNRWNSQGHDGIFLSKKDQDKLESHGYKVGYHQKTVFWCFTNTDEMSDFVRLLFGLDLNPSSEQLIRALYNLGYAKSNESLMLEWPMVYIECIKT